MVVADSVGAERTAFIESLEALLRPLMPLMLNYGVTYSDTQEVLRALFVDAIGDRVKAQGRPSTNVRLALMAGMNRSEVEKLTNKREERDRLRALRAQRLDQVSAILTVWHDDPRFNTPYGAPLDLSLEPEGGFKTVDELFKVACPDVERDLLLDELIAAGCVEVHGSRFIRCTSRAFLPGSADVSGIARIGRYGGNLNSTFVYNLTREQDQPSYFERTVVTEALVNEKFRDEALGYLRTHGQAFLENCDRWITEREADYQSPKGKRVGVSMFFYEEDVSVSIRASMQGKLS